MAEKLTKTSGGDKVAYRKAAEILFSNSGLPAKVTEILGKSAPEKQAKFLTDCDLIAGIPSPLEIFEKLAAANPPEIKGGLVVPKTLVVKGAVSYGFHKWAFAHGVKTVDPKKDQPSNAMIDPWFSLIRNPNVADIINLVKYRGDVQFFAQPGKFVIDNAVVDLGNLTVNNKKAKPFLAILPGGTVRMVDPIGAIYFALSHGCSTKSPSAALDLTFGKVFDPEAMVKQDEATQAFFISKTPVFYLDFTTKGFYLTAADEGQSAKVYEKVTRAAAHLSGHYQGKYFYNMLSGKLPMTVCLETGTAWLASEALEKMWKRHTLLFPLAVRLQNPDTGYFRTADGLTHQGRRVCTLNVVGGVNLPYLGMASATVSRSELAERFRAIREEKHEFVWQGDFTEKLRTVELGTEVSEGQALVVEGAPEATPSRIDGIVEKSTVEFDGYKTYVTILVSTLDKTGQFKLRSLGGAKVQLSVVGLTGIDWAEASSVLGFANPQKANGDFALSGISDDDEVEVVLNTDSSKIYGKTASAAGLVAIAAETTKTVVNYNAQAHFNGEYDNLVQGFLKANTRKVQTVHSVTASVAEHFVALNRPDVVVRGYSNVVTQETTWVVIQDAEAIIGYDLMKVEYTPVEAALTTSRFMLETAAMARTMGMSHYAKQVFDGGDKAFDLAKRVYNSVLKADSEGNLRLPDGRTLKEAGIPVVYTNKQQPEDMAKVMRSFAQDLKAYKKAVAFVDTYRKEDGSVIIRDMVLVDPELVKQMGSGKETLGSIFAQLCTAIADGNVTLAGSLVARCRGKVAAIADSRGNSKRLNRGAETVVCKTVGGMTPDGWVALSAHGAVAKLMARIYGFTSVQDMILSGLLVGSAVRSPQNAPLPLKFWFPDVSPEIWSELARRGLVPQGSRRSSELLEPHRIYMSPRDTAWCHGDHDGDTRAFHLSLGSPEARQELLAFDVETHRIAVLENLQLNVEDPVAEAFKLEAKKMVLATKAVQKSLDDLHKQNVRTIRHQTIVLGQGFELAHVALVTAEINPNSSRSATAHAMWVGPYEVNLGGADDDQIALFGLLERNPFKKDDETSDVERWKHEILKLVAKVNWTEKIGKLMMLFNEDIVAAKSVEKARKHNPLTGEALLHALHAAAYRRISKGCYAQGKLDDLIAVLGENYSVPVGGKPVLFMDFVRARATAGSVTAKVVSRFFDEVYPLIVSKDAGRESEEDFAG